MQQILKIISGGQTGADQGGWLAAKELGIDSGGHMPLHFKTEAGFHPEFAGLYGAEESTLAGYPHRTRQNVWNSDGTVIFGDFNSGGSKMTIKYCNEVKKPYFTVTDKNDGAVFRLWLEGNCIRILNVAGNRESKNLGIAQYTKDFLVKELHNLKLVI